MQRGDSSCVQTVPQCKIMQDRLSKVQQLQATERAFAAILADGLVTTWGDRCRQTPRCCGLIFPGRGPPDNYSGVIPRHFPAGCCQMQRSDTAVVVCRLFHSARSAQQSAATSSHRACICRDIGRWIGDYLGRSMQTNTTLLWSHFFLAEDLQTTTAVSFRGIFQQVAAKCSGVTPLLCADCSTVQDRLSKVQQLQATERAFAAILADGLVTTWGDRCRQTPRCCGLIFFWQRTSRQLQRCHSAAFSSRLLPNAAE